MYIYLYELHVTKFKEKDVSTKQSHTLLKGFQCTSQNDLL